MYKRQVQANTIKQLSADGKLDEETLERYLFSVERHSKKKDITLKNERLAEYFEEETTEDEMMDVIFELLEKCCLLYTSWRWSGESGPGATDFGTRNSEGGIPALR